MKPDEHGNRRHAIQRRRAETAESEKNSTDESQLFMMMSECSGDCGEIVGYAFVAQYKSNVETKEYGDDVVFCKKCWDRGWRMWVDGKGGYATGTACPEGYYEAVLFWDEGGYVTGRNTRRDVTYPSIKQPAVNYYISIFHKIISDPRYQNNLDWGKARFGHPEGTVRAHITEIEQNLEILKPKLSDIDFWKLRILIHTHDSFKAASKRGVSITDPDSHASLARSFLSDFCDDMDLLAMVQFHDEPFALWRQVESKGIYNKQRMIILLNSIEDWNLFLAFNIIDGCTKGKSREPLVWLFKELENMVVSDFTVVDII